MRSVIDLPGRSSRVAELHDMTWDFICFSETRAATADSELHGNHRLIRHRGKEYGGVAILIHASCANHVTTKTKMAIEYWLSN